MPLFSRRVQMAAVGVSQIQLALQQEHPGNRWLLLPVLPLALGVWDAAVCISLRGEGGREGPCRASITARLRVEHGNDVGGGRVVLQIVGGTDNVPAIMPQFQHT